MASRNRYASIELEEEVERNDRDSIRDFLTDLGVDVPSELDEDREDDGNYRLEATISLQGNYNSEERFSNALQNNSEVVGVIDGNLLYDGEKIEVLDNETYTKPAYAVFPESATHDTSGFRNTFESKTEAESNDKASAD